MRNFLHNKVFLLIALIAFPQFANAGQKTNSAAQWEPFKFLIGDWMGEGTGKPGEASGGFSFQFDLQSKILVRRNYAEYPATAERAAFRHDDLMIIFEDPSNPAGGDGSKFRAVYFDNEGHVINYRVSFADSGSTLSFVSDPAASQPRFKFTYRKTSESKMSFEFDIAPPGKPEEFSKYLSGDLRRK